MDSAALSSARTFYAVTACINVCTWSMLPLASYLRYPVVTRPSWLPARVLRALCWRPVYLALCRGSPAVLLCAAARPDTALLRLLAASWHTCYQLAESRQALSLSRTLTLTLAVVLASTLTLTLTLALTLTLTPTFSLTLITVTLTLTETLTLTRTRTRSAASRTPTATTPPG